MKYGVGLGCYPCAIEEQLRYMVDSGFETTFVGSGHPELDRVMRTCRAAGIEVENYHAPFGGINYLWQDVPEAQTVVAYLNEGVARCAMYEVPTIVVHLSSGAHPPRISELGMERLEKLVRYAKSLGVTVAFENQRMLGNLSYALEIFPDAAFCWDTGHEACFTYGREYMPLFGDRIAALHVHDNHQEYDKDEHLIPGDGSIDFERVARQLARVRYTKSMMLELAFCNRPQYTDMSAAVYYARAAAAARRIAMRVEALRYYH